MISKNVVKEYMRFIKMYEKPDWAIKQIERGSGLIEDICEHGIGHPNKEWLEENDPDDTMKFSVHGCDGCCEEE